MFILTDFLALSPNIAKILTEIILFILSFSVQYFLIYPRKKMLNA